MTTKAKLIKGMHDILPPEIGTWHFMEDNARLIFECAGYQEIRTPLLEELELFQRSVGKQTDIVQKEMFVMQDRKGRSLALRPEGTASTVRALINAGRDGKEVERFYYLGPMFRYERPQKGRQRQFHQMGVELFGSASPWADADLLVTLLSYLKTIGLNETVLQLNSLGDGACRPLYLEKLMSYLTAIKKELCDDCQRRIDSNPLRVLDCKNPDCQKVLEQAPSPLDHLCGECRDHFNQLQDLLTSQGHTFTVNPRMVRGLDYYNRTVFEFVSSNLGAQNAIGGGGRYDTLVEEMGGKPTPAIGFAMGLERVVLLLQELDVQSKPVQPTALIALGEAARAAAFDLASQLRQHGLPVIFEYEELSFKNQLKRANRRDLDTVLILGDNELEQQTVTLKDFRSGEQVSVALAIESIIGALRSRQGLHVATE